MVAVGIDVASPSEGVLGWLVECRGVDDDSNSRGRMAFFACSAEELQLGPICYTLGSSELPHCVDAQREIIAELKPTQREHRGLSG